MTVAGVREQVNASTLLYIRGIQNFNWDKMSLDKILIIDFRAYKSRKGTQL